MNADFGRILMFIGAVIMLSGIIVYFAGDKLKWIGNLPGDFKIEKKNFKFYFPLTSLIILSLILNFLIRFMRHLK